ESPAAFGAPSPAAALGTPFGRRCIPAPPRAATWETPSDIPDILDRRALPAGRIAALGATLDFHHGLLGSRSVHILHVVLRRHVKDACQGDCRLAARLTLCHTLAPGNEGSPRPPTPGFPRRFEAKV